MPTNDIDENDDATPLLINAPIQWARSFKFSKSAHALRFKQDKNGNVWSMPVVMCDPSGLSGVELTNRTPQTMILASLAADGAIWAPAAGYRFRLQKLTVHIPSTATTGTAGLAQITDGLGGYGFGLGFWVGATNGATFLTFDLGPSGYVSTDVGNQLSLNLTADLTAGEIVCTAYGWEELG